MTSKIEVNLTVLDDSWKLEGACRGMDVNLFYGSEGEHSSKVRVREREMIEFCNNACKVRARCLLWALFIPEEMGVWGGKTEIERKRLRADPAVRTFLKQFRIDSVA